MIITFFFSVYECPKQMVWGLCYYDTRCNYYNLWVKTRHSLHIL